jgi:hypothetical protein
LKQSFSLFHRYIVINNWSTLSTIEGQRLGSFREEVELAVIVKVAKSSVLETSFAAVRRHGNVITSSEIRRSSPCGLQLS